MPKFIDKDGNERLNLKYSTEEQFTGRYWLDGKKIYSQTSTWNDLSKGFSSWAHNISNVDSIVDYNAKALYSGDGTLYKFPCVYYDGGTSGNYYDVYFTVDKSKVRKFCNVDWKGYTFYLTIYYTKS